MGVKEYSITDDSLEFGYKDAEDFESERLMIIFDVAKDLYCHNRNMSAKDAITWHTTSFNDVILRYKRTVLPRESYLCSLIRKCPSEVYF